MITSKLITCENRAPVHARWTSRWFMNKHIVWKRRRNFRDEWAKQGKKVVLELRWTLALFVRNYEKLQILRSQDQTNRSKIDWTGENQSRIIAHSRCRTSEMTFRVWMARSGQKFSWAILSFSMNILAMFAAQPGTKENFPGLCHISSALARLVFSDFLWFFSNRQKSLQKYWKKILSQFSAGTPEKKNLKSVKVSRKY